MAHKAPGKSHRRGISLVKLLKMFPDDEKAREWFEKKLWPTGPRLPLLWLPGRSIRHQAQDHDSPLPGLPQAAHVQPENRQHHGRLEARLSEVGDRHLPSDHQPQRRVQHEDAPRP